MDDPMRRLEKVLAPLGESCEFVASGTLPLVLPGLEVEGAGVIGLPISADEARRLIAAADQAPYGRGAETIVDTDVRRVWQIEPSRFELRNPAWESHVKQIVKAVRRQFAIDGKVRHELYKLLVYETGSFFAPHRDTEKTAGMFATLVICLPSSHEGGTLVVEHERETRRIELGGPDSEFLTSYAAFYADCRHEITPVRSGYRVCLIYNLALKSAGPQPTAPRNSQAVAEAAAILRELFTDPCLERVKLVIPLDHQYTEAGLDPGALKGADRPQTEVLTRAAASLDYDCSLALVTHYEMGPVDLDTWTPPDFRSRRSYRKSYGREELSEPEDDDSADLEEVIEETITLTHWVGLNGDDPAFGTLHVDDDELLCGEDRTDWAVRQQIHEATGNEGANLERWYHRCAIVIWPRTGRFRILAAEGQAVALPELERIAARAEDPEALSACREFAGDVLNHWRAHGYSRSPSDHSGRMLAVLNRIGAIDLAARFIEEVLPLDFTGREGQAIARLGEHLGWEALRPAVAAFLQRQQPSPYDGTPARSLSVLAPLYGNPAAWNDERQAVCASLAQELDQLFQRFTSEKAPRWLADKKPPAGLVANAVRVFALGSQPEVLDRFLDGVLRGELGCSLREVLAPDLKAIAGWLPEAPAARPAYARLRKHCLAQLRAATAEPVEFPTDWRRSAELNCRCQDCGALAVFLRDAATPAARFSLNAERRSHLQSQIERCECDCTHETERKGRPFTLVCEKTTASYERRERQYRADRQLLEEIERLPGHHQPE